MKLFESPVAKNSPLPAHKQVREKLLALIKSGELGPNAKLPSEPQIAERLGVSRMTANKAILSLVAEGWLVREKGRGTFVAPAPTALQKCAVAIVPDIIPAALEDYYFGAIYWNIQVLLSEHGLPVEVVRLDDAIAERISQGTGVVAVNPPEGAVAPLARLRRQGVPVVLVGASWNDCDVDTVDSDNLLGPAIAVNHLADLGHRRILLAASYPTTSNTQDRVRGFRVAMKARQLEAAPGDEFMAPGYTLNEEQIAEVLRRIRGGATAVFAAGPRLAMQILVAAQRERIPVPDRLSIVGYDDPAYISFAHPPITTVRQPLAEMAKLAFKIVWDFFREGDRPPKRHVLDPQLVVRGSTAPAPGAELAGKPEPVR